MQVAPFKSLRTSHKIFIFLMQVVNYLGCSWGGSFNLTVDVVEKTLMMTQSQQDNDTDIKQMFLNAHIDRIASCNITLFTQYWIANKTELFLQVRVSIRRNLPSYMYFELL